MSNRFAALLMALIVPTSLLADVALTDRDHVARAIQDRAVRHRNKKEGDKKNHPRPRDLGDLPLIDGEGLKYFINTDITFTTSSSASGAVSEASYTHAVAASTSMGGTTSSVLTDMFDGYGAICLSTDGSNGPCEEKNPSFQMYDQTGASPTPDASCNSRQYAFPAQTLFNNIEVQRKVFVPTNDGFIRWMNIFTNTGTSPITFRMITSNNLGSQFDTAIISSSNGDNVADITDTWITSFQNFDMSNKSSDPRIGHILQGAGAPNPVNFISFVDGDDRPFWSYLMTLAPGQTKIILTFATGQGTKAAANMQAARLAGLPDTAKQCLSATDLTELGNFAPVVPPEPVPALSPYAAALAAILLALVGAVALRLRGGA